MSHHGLHSKIDNSTQVRHKVKHVINATCNYSNSNKTHVLASLHSCRLSYYVHIQLGVIEFLFKAHSIIEIAVLVVAWPPTFQIRIYRVLKNKLFISWMWSTILDMTYILRLCFCNYLTEQEKWTFVFEYNARRINVNKLYEFKNVWSVYPTRQLHILSTRASRYYVNIVTRG